MQPGFKREYQIQSLFDAIKDGPTENKEWLRQAISDHFNGLAVALEIKKEIVN